MKRPLGNSTLTASDRLRDKLAETGEDILDVGHIAKQAVQEKYAKIKAAAGDGVQAGKDRLTDFGNGLDERVSEHPIKYRVIAA